MRVFHLDCGRKYFSERQIKNLIDEMAQDGYNYLELAVGNDGLRFLLDDMSLKYSIGASAVEAEEEEPAVRDGGGSPRRGNARSRSGSKSGGKQ